MEKELPQISCVVAEKCAAFIYQTLLKSGPKTEYELAKLYIQNHMKGRFYTDRELDSESANFGFALVIMSNPGNRKDRIFCEGKFYIPQ